MTSVSIICVKKDAETALEALSSFGEFHIEPTLQDEANLAEYNQSIQKIEEAIADADWLGKQFAEEIAGLLRIFRPVQPTKLRVTAENWQTLFETTSQQITALKKEIENLDESLGSLREKIAQLNYIKNVLTTMDRLGADLTVMEDLKLIHVALASVPIKTYEVFEKAVAGYPIILHRCGLTKEVDFVCIAMPSKHWPEIEKILKTHRAEIFSVPEELPHDVAKALKEVDNQLKEDADKEKALAESINKLGHENKNKITSWKETEENIRNLIEAERKMLQSGHLATVKGFVPQKRFSELSEKVNTTLQSKAIVLQNEETSADPPTKITHSRFIKPFEEITKLYGLPVYSELDPTPMMAITFPILFGLMFGDVGHGLVLLIGGLTVGKLIKGNQGMKNVCFIMAACGAGATVAGLLFGEAFGVELPWGPLWFSPFSPTQNVFNFLIFSLFVGMVQIVSGLVMELVNFAIKHQYVDALLTSGAKIAFYVGGVYLIATCQLDFGKWFAGPILAPVIPFIIMVVGKPLYLRIAKPAAAHTGEHAEQDTLIGRLFEGGDFFTRLLSNTISYSRILALLMAHWALLLVVYQVSGLVGSAGTIGLVLSGIVIVGGNIFVLALEGLIVFIHTLRLHFYEWFSKFYAGTGTEFNPFKQRFVYTEVVLGGKQKAEAN
jgi:V/A-type H+-transporting ATPase subunit I